MRKIENKKVLLGLHQYRMDSRWIAKQYNKLKKRYKGKWIAVYKEQILDNDKGIEHLLRRLRQKGYNPGDIVIEYIPIEESIMVL